jgi:peptide/nickel transport system ATP-binding protein
VNASARFSLRVEGLVVVAADGARLLDGADVAVAGGEIVVVAGASGAGKTSLFAALLGRTPSGGSVAWTRFEVRADGVLYAPRDAADPAFVALRRRVFAYLPQSPALSLDPLRSVGRELRDALLRAGRPAADAAPARLRALLAAVGVREDAVEDPPYRLSGGEAQRAALAVAAATEAPFRLLDEPTSGLDPTVAAALLRDLRARVDAGAAALVATHDPRLAAGIADRVAVVDRGRLVETADVASFFAGPVSAAGRAFVAAAAPAPPRAPVDAARIAVRAAGLVRTYGARRALNGVDLRVPRGSTLAVVGESGGGKSTLARIVAGIDRPDAGRIELDVDAPPGSPRRAQLVWQDAAATLDPRPPARVAVTDALRAAGGGGDLAERLDAIARTVGLPVSAFDRPPGALSGGERQRVGLARALACDPEILVLDEAFAALDVASRREVAERVARRPDGSRRTLLLVTHDLPLAAAVADRVAVLYRGAIVEEGPAADVLGAPRSEYARTLVAAAPPARPADRAAWLAAGEPARA